MFGTEDSIYGKKVPIQISTLHTEKALDLSTEDELK